METFVRIDKVLPLQERPYTDHQGQPKTFISRGVIVSTGTDRYYGEIVGDAARLFAPTALNGLWSLQGTFSTREWQDQQGMKHYSIDLRINKLVQL